MLNAECELILIGLYSLVNVFTCKLPVLFTCYAATLDDFVEERSAYLSGYADDHALMDSFRPGDGNSERECLLSLEQTITSVREWMVLNHLKMNDSKTEYIIFVNAFQLQKMCI